MSNFMQAVDERTRLAGANKLEILLFSLGADPASGREEVFGLNVFKVREVMREPQITRAPQTKPGVLGLVSLRGSMVPVVDLATLCGLTPKSGAKILIVTEINRQTQGFLVEAVENIHRLEWSQVKVPPEMLNGPLDGLVTAVTELPDQRIVMILDVEKVLAETTGQHETHPGLQLLQGLDRPTAHVVFADDSAVARKQIAMTLDRLGVKHTGLPNGAAAWAHLSELADQAQAGGVPLASRLRLILTDIEMPEMDGFVLARKIKSDTRFAGIPVVMHSSLSGETNQNLGRLQGADAFVSKFDPAELAAALTPFLLQEPQA